MKPTFLSRHHQRWLGVRALLLPLLAVAALLVSTGSAAADLSNTLTTSTAVAPGGTLVTSVPSGVTITASADVTGCPSSGIGTSSVTYTCDPRGSGIAAGQTIAQTFSGGARFEETITYNANGPSPASIDPVLGPIFPGACSGTTSTTTSTLNALAVSSGGSVNLPPDSWNCIVAISSTSESGAGSGAILQAVLLANPGQSVEITSAPNGISGGCFGYGFVLPTDSSNVDAQVHYQCPPVPNPGGWHLAISVQTTGSRVAPVFDTEISPGPQPAGVAPPILAPTTQTVRIGVLLPPVSVINLPTTGTFSAFAQPASNSSATPVLTSIDPATGAPGTTVTLTGANLVSGDPASTTVAFGATQAAGVSCSADGTRCTATAPALAPGDVSVTLSNPAGTSNALTFTASATQPTSAGS